jgi:hypothetical protein
MRVTAGEPGSIFNDRVRGRATGLNDRPCRRAVCRFADRVGRAEVARAGNADQCREVDRSPFIDRPIEVGWLLRLHGQPDDVIAAGPLHDVHEETATTGAELQRRFGALIAWLVESGSDDPSVVDDKFRKRELRARARTSPRTRSPKSGSWRCCQRGNSLSRGPARGSPISVRASRCCTEPQVSSPWSITSTPSPSGSSH